MHMLSELIGYTMYYCLHPVEIQIYGAVNLKNSNDGH
jgi:hypothetical protein